MADDVDRVQQRADVLAARVEALAEAFHASGIPEEVSAQLLATASAAVLQALRLELLVEQRPAGPAEPEHRLVPPVVRLAA